MSTIIAARLQLQDEVNEAIAELEQAGFARDRISSFYLNPPGQHATYPIGGDRFESPGAKETGKGAGKGAAVGAAAGAVVGAGLSPAGAALGGLIGAHAGSLAGSLSHTKGKGEKEELDDQPDRAPPPVRRGGMLIAVALPGQQIGNGEERGAVGEATRVLRHCGATELEQAEGEIVAGDWRDFDPLSTPHFL